jgi:hypothetical protein
MSHLLGAADTASPLQRCRAGDFAAVFAREQNEDGVLEILDFGIARIADSGMTADGTLVGTLNYMSPEQMMGHTRDATSDVFAVGAVMYELLSYTRNRECCSIRDPTWAVITPPS